MRKPKRVKPTLYEFTLALTPAEVNELAADAIMLRGLAAERALENSPRITAIKKLDAALTTVYQETLK